MMISLYYKEVSYNTDKGVKISSGLIIYLSGKYQMQ